jgi:high frequency lysogenization protein
MNTIEQQTLALAGVAQAARLVDQISKTGEYPVEFLTPLINSLFAFEPGEIGEIYGGTQSLKLGLQNLSALLGSTDEKPDVARYLFSILYLERRFSANQDMVQVVRSRLEHAQFKADHFSSHVNEVCHSLSGIYQDTLSTLKFRVRVNGSVQQLENTTNSDAIRALLLAGVRSAHLWHQLGGRRWKLMLQRKKTLHTAQQLSRQMSVV